MLMSNDEAVALVHGEMLTLRDGDVTHQAVQTNLADVICGGKMSLVNYFLSLTSPRAVSSIDKVHNLFRVYDGNDFQRKFLSKNFLCHFLRYFS